MAKKKARSVLILADMHCGSLVGLTPPNYRIMHDPELLEYQKHTWSLYLKMLKDIGPVDILVVNGDATDGKAARQGGCGLITSDIDVQAMMAARCIERVKTKKIHMVYGTPYHTGESQDHENQVASLIGADRIEGHAFLQINGLIFDVKHKVGGSTIPHGRHTAIARERLWNVLWGERGESPKADVIIRSHVHFFSYAGGHNWLALTTPALQGLGSIYGVRQCSGTVDFGMVVFHVRGKDDYSWHPYIVPTVGPKDFLTII